MSRSRNFKVVRGELTRGRRVASSQEASSTSSRTLRSNLTPPSVFVPSTSDRSLFVTEDWRRSGIHIPLGTRIRLTLTGPLIRLLRRWLSLLERP